MNATCPPYRRGRQGLAGGQPLGLRPLNLWSPSRCVLQGEASTWVFNEVRTVVSDLVGAVSFICALRSFLSKLLGISNGFKLHVQATGFYSLWFWFLFHQRVSRPLVACQPIFLLIRSSLCSLVFASHGQGDIGPGECTWLSRALSGLSELRRDSASGVSLGDLSCHARPYAPPCRCRSQLPHDSPCLG